MADSSANGLRAFSPFPAVFSKDIQQTRKSQGLFGKGLIVWKLWPAQKFNEKENRSKQLRKENNS